MSSFLILTHVALFQVLKIKFVTKYSGFHNYSVWNINWQGNCILHACTYQENRVLGVLPKKNTHS